MRELALHILDLLQNTIEAGATQVQLHIHEDLDADRLSITVQDNGRGMDSDSARRALDPFFTTRTTRHVGLGLPLLAAAARRCEGDLSVESVPKQGTTVTATFRHSHLDRAPLGAMAPTLLAFLLSGNGRQPQLRFQHQVNDHSFTLDTAAIEAEMGEIPLSYPPLRDWLYDYINEGEAAVSSPEKGGYDAKAQVA
jgi:anti-sigma regulatory factor (Ser/Thr protein kinase)